MTTPTPPPTAARDDALRTALALCESYGNDQAAEALLGGYDERESLLRVLGAAVSVAHHLTVVVAEALEVPVEHVTATTRQLFETTIQEETR